MNKEVIAIDQDREGVQGVAVRKEGECTLAPPNRPAAAAVSVRIDQTCACNSSVTNTPATLTGTPQPGQADPQPTHHHPIPRYVGVNTFRQSHPPK